MNTINVLYQHDDNYAVFGGVSIVSLFINNRDAEDICVYLIDIGLSEEYKKQYRDLAVEYGRRIEFLPAIRLIQHLEEVGFPKYRGSYATYMKILIAEALPSEVKRIYYLDSDTLVTGSLQPLFEMDMKGQPLYMVVDGLSTIFKDSYGFAPEEPYFCGGTMLIDPLEWKKQKYTNRLIEYAKNVRCAFYAADQDLMNNVFRGEIGTLDVRYDFTYIHTIYDDSLILKYFKGKKYYSEKELMEAREHVVVLHFMRFLGEGPWNKNTLHPHSEQFDRYLKMSPWKDYEKIASDKGGLFRIEKVMYKYLPRFLFFHIYVMFIKYYVTKTDKKLQKTYTNNIE
jgi:lipopolysaccharide biosynthesis glycosyltransferase